MLLEAKLHLPRYKVEEGLKLQLLPSTLTLPLSLFSTSILAGLRFGASLHLCVYLWGQHTYL
jgi:hypothetical protein